jgi:hypothetical protein
MWIVFLSVKLMKYLENNRWKCGCEDEEQSIKTSKTTQTCSPFFFWFPGEEFRIWQRNSITTKKNCWEFGLILFNCYIVHLVSRGRSESFGIYVDYLMNVTKWVISISTCRPTKRFLMVDCDWTIHVDNVYINWLTSKIEWNHEVFP